MSVVLADGFEAVVDVVLAPLVVLPFPFTPLLLLYFLWLPCLLSVVGLALVVLGFSGCLASLVLALGLVL